MNEEENKALSINAESSEINLENNSSDRLAQIVKAGLGMVPVVGSILQEAVTITIPNQRMDRVVLTLNVFAQKVNYLEEEVLRLKMSSEKFTDLLEDAIPQAARALSEERREYIASFLKNSLTSEELNLIQEKKILSILGALNDAEIIFLRYESLRPHEQNDFFQQHQVVLQPVKAAINSPRSEHDKYALRISFNEKLLELGLLERKFLKPQSGKYPEWDEKTGMLKAQYLNLTQLGRLLLRYIDQPSSSDKAQDELSAQKQRLNKE